MQTDRRSFLWITGAALIGPRARAQSRSRTLAPHASWDCGLKDGIPSPENGTLLFEARMDLALLADAGKTPFGRRRVAVAQQGTVTGPALTARVMPGALEFALTLSNGVVEVEQILVFQTTDGKYIYSRSACVGPDASDVRVVMDFEAPYGSAVEWLNTGKYVARRVLDDAAKTLTVRVYDASAAGVDPANAVRIAKPEDAPPQPWNNRARSDREKPGKELIVESVTLAPSQRVGPSKRGSRNIIPITGGELSGRITGKILPGGADYQNLSAPPAIDARYLWQTSDGEIIIVRNTTSTGGLVPVFEARLDGPYAYLNTGKFLSSNPAPASGGVKITMYESAE